MVDHYSRPGSALAAVMFGVTWAAVQLFGAMSAAVYGDVGLRWFGLGLKPGLTMLLFGLLLVIGSLLLLGGVTRWFYVAVVVVEVVMMVDFLTATGAYGWVTVMMIGPVIGLVFALVPATGRWLR